MTATEGGLMRRRLGELLETRRTGFTAALDPPFCAVKVHQSYPAPIWREHGLSASAHGPLPSSVDDSPPDESAGVLTGFVGEVSRHEEEAMTHG
jgi:hypothetical protein